MRLTYVQKMAASSQIWFDPTRIIKEGYLTKSPPLSEETLIKKRFRLRWFVLCYVGVEPTLFYFKDEKCRKQEKPKGRISLVGVEVFKQRSKVNGFPFVINIQTDDRLYHLCSTQKEVHEEWLEKLREYHIPNTEIPRCPSSALSCTCSRSLGEAAQPVSVNDLISEATQQQQKHQQQCYPSTGNELSYEGDDCNEDPYDRPYATKRSYVVNTSNTYTKQTSVPYSQHRRNPSLSYEMKSRSLDVRRRSDESELNRNRTLTFMDKFESADSLPMRPLFECPINQHSVLTEEVEEEEDEDTSYVTMDQTQGIEEIKGSMQTTSPAAKEDNVEDSRYITMTDAHEPVDKSEITKTADVCESEDEGIGRSDSDSSGTSSITSTRATCSNHAKKLLEDALRISMHDKEFYNESYVGPRLVSFSKQNKKMSRSRSLDDLLES